MQVVLVAEVHTEQVYVTDLVPKRKRQRIRCRVIHIGTALVFDAFFERLLDECWPPRLKLTGINGFCVFW